MQLVVISIEHGGKNAAAEMLLSSMHLGESTVAQWNSGLGVSAWIALRAISRDGSRLSVEPSERNSERHPSPCGDTDGVHHSSGISAAVTGASAAKRNTPPSNAEISFLIITSSYIPSGTLALRP
jgi:hypothetical protein